MATESQLEHLFRSCDKQGNGYIGPLQFRSLCAEYDIAPGDSDIIFADLDHDGDGKISLRDFAWGFQDFLGAGASSRRPSVQLGEEAARQAHNAWTQLIEGVGEDSVHTFLNTSGKKLADLYHELQNANASSHLVHHFEDALHMLLHDVKKIHDEKNKLEEWFKREKEAHLAQLRSIEDELDGQVAQIEARAIEEARAKFEIEKKSLEEQMELETAQLQAHLQLCQKLNEVLSKTKEAGDDYKYQVAAENMELRTALADTTRNLIMLQTEMAQLRCHYEEKCQILNSQQADLVAFVEHSAHTNQQLQLMHETNKNLQDINDELLDKLDCSTSLSYNQRYNMNEMNKICFKKLLNYGKTLNVDTLRTGIDEISKSGQDPDICVNDLLVSTFTTDDFPHKSGKKRNNNGRRNPTSEDRVLISKEKIGAPEELSEMHSRSISKQSIPSKRKLLFPDPRIGIINDTLQEEDDLSITGPPDRTYKVVFAGDAAVGKSSFIYRLCKGKFVHNLGATLGVDFQIKSVRMENKVIALQLWDTAGQERFRSMTKNYFRRADGVLLIYDVTSERTFKSIRNWLQDIHEITEQQIPIILCGNKIDLRYEAKQQGITCVDLVCGEQLAGDNGVTFFETSCKSGINILDSVLTLTREMLTNEDFQVKSSSLHILKNEPKKSSCCSGRNNKTK